MDIGLSSTFENDRGDKIKVRYYLLEKSENPETMCEEWGIMVTTDDGKETEKSSVRYLTDDRNKACDILHILHDNFVTSTTLLDVVSNIIH